MKTSSAFLSVLLVGSAVLWQTAAAQGQTHVWEKVELTFHAENQYTNPYTQVVVWVDLQGPGFDKRCYGFWDGSNVFPRARPRHARRANGPGTAARTSVTPD